MNQRHNRRTSTLAMMLSDGLAFFIAGGVALGISVAIGHADSPTLAGLLEFDSRNRILDFIIGAIIWISWFHAIKNRYRKRIPFWSEQAETLKAVLLMALVNLALIALARNDYSRTLWLFGWLALAVTIPLLRALVRYLLSRAMIWQIPTYIIGDGSNATETQIAIQSEWQMGFRVQAQFNLSCDGDSQIGIPEKLAAWLKTLEKRVRPSDTAFVLAPDEAHSENIQQIIRFLTLSGVRHIYFAPDIRGIPLYGAEINYFFSHEILLLRLKNNLESTASRWFKRLFDLCIGGLLFIPASLLVAGAGILIVLEDGLPVFYTQVRQGRGGKPFRIIKLRSMRKDADLTMDLWKTNHSPEWQEYLANNNKIKDDPRLLRVGGRIRQLSIDELPQILNVLKGEMSFVGPRPILESEIQQYGDNIVLYNAVRPALTGLWQISGRSDTTFVQRSSLDAWYVRNWSLGLDIVILLKTFMVLFCRRGAY